MLILDGMVRVNGEICTQRNKKIRPADEVEIEDYGKLLVKGL